MYSQIQKCEVYMVCEKESIGLSRNFKAQSTLRGSGAKAPRKISVESLFTLAQNTSTDHILVFVVLELLITLQQLFKLAFPVKFFNMIFLA